MDGPNLSGSDLSSARIDKVLCHDQVLGYLYRKSVRFCRRHVRLNIRAVSYYDIIDNTHGFGQQ